jgi:purine-binding chemotaxis protein CheW
MKGQTYGFSIGKVQEINRMMDITPVPKTSRSILGVMNLRGKVIPVVDLSLQLGMGPSDSSKNTCIIVTECDFGPVGVVVDFVNTVMENTASQIEVLPVGSE